MQYNDGYSDNILSFVNNVRTKDGGTHETGLKLAITKALNDYARKTGLLKEKDKNLEGSDYREGLSAVLSVLIPEEHLQFEGQTKTKLGNSEVRGIVDTIVTENLNEFFELCEIHKSKYGNVFSYTLATKDDFNEASKNIENNI
jgi:topoisomerase-4 subunit B